MQEIPRNGIGVAGGSGDEHPNVGSSQELGGQFPVGSVDGIDIRSIQQCHPFGNRVGRHQSQLTMHVTTKLLGASGAGQARQDGGVGEPLRVVRVMDQYRRPSGRTQHPGTADVGCYQGMINAPA